MSFQTAIVMVLQQEGGYVNDPHDPGGETNFGICKRSYPNVDIKNLTKEAASDIYKRDFWDKCSCDQLPGPIAALVFDTAVNMGVRTAIIFLQGAVGVSADGVIGAQTLNAVKKLDPIKVGKKFMSLRIQKYTQLNTWNLYGLGWTARCFEVFYQSFLA